MRWCTCRWSAAGGDRLLLLLAFGRAGRSGLAAETGSDVFMFRWTGAALASAVMALPLMVRAMRLSIEAVDRRLEEAARTLGAGRWRVFLTITLPLSLPGMLAGLVLGFARAIGEFGATITFVSNIPGETQTLPLAIYAALQMPGGDALVRRLAVISVLLSLAALVASELHRCALSRSQSEIDASFDQAACAGC